MLESPARTCTAFDTFQRIAHGSLADVALVAKTVLLKKPEASILVFDDATGSVIDLDLRGAAADVVNRLAGSQRAPAAQPPDEGEDSRSGGRSRGRPRLGVVAREVTLMPRHWQWLAGQRGGASAALRRLVDEARRADLGRTHVRASQERTYRFMSALAGNLAGFEEAARALFAGERERFAEHTATWPSDVRTHAFELAWSAPTASDSKRRD